MIDIASHLRRNPMRQWIVGAACAVSSALLSAVLAGIGTADAAPPGALAPPDIQTTFFNGEPFTSSTPQNIKFTMVFTADGKMTRAPLGKTGVKGEGTWKLSNDGFCTTWKTATTANCFSLIAAGDKKWSVLKGASVIGTWSK
jgi:hypothetical protein